MDWSIQPRLGPTGHQGFAHSLPGEIPTKSYRRLAQSLLRAPGSAIAAASIVNPPSGEPHQQLRLAAILVAASGYVTIGKR